MLYLKNGVHLTMPQAVAVMIAVVQQVYKDQPCMITSATDGVHGSDSLHFRGLALDFRTKHLPEAEKYGLVGEVKRRLGREFDVVLEDWGGENEHLHVEFDPEG